MSNPIQMKDALGVVIFKVKNYLFPDGEVGTAPVVHGPNGQPLFTSDQPGHVALDAQAAGLSTSAGQASQLTQLQALVTALGGTLTVNAPNGARIPVDIGSATVTISGPVTVANEVEIKNDSGSPVPTAPQSNAPRKRQTGALAALNAAITLPVDGMSTVLLRLSGAWVGTVALFGSADDGQTYDIPLTLIPYSGGAAVSAMSANGAWEMACGALTHVQAVMTAFTSGSATALLMAGAGAKSVRVGAPVGNPLPIRRGLGTRIDASGAKPTPTANGNVLLGTIAADPARNGDWFAQNQSASDLLLVLDDGNDTPSLTTMLPMNLADSAGRQGGSYTSQNLGPHVGRLRVYGPAGAQFALTAQ